MCKLWSCTFKVLDDNRELFIPETQQLVKAHPHFMLFGTQNPPGVYGGRKVLSRAFRNRFVELHFEDIPSNELVHILNQCSSLPTAYAKKMVAVMKNLQVNSCMYDKYCVWTIIRLSCVYSLFNLPIWIKTFFAASHVFGFSF